ncbi:Zfp827 [Phodopus roborovskii]|uniref:Zfp827 protein n=1 Tax=Phodopus roborovskii TaxID=109678 RepID=A0AAV0A7D2_PHORO|nr:Zfp827 [Phodopus roborovskii]
MPPSPFEYVSRQAEAEGEFSEGEHWYGNSSETLSEASYGEVQENYTLSLEDRIQEQSTSPETSLGSATPSSHTLELVALDGEVLRDSLQCQDHLSPGVSSVCDDDPPSSNKPLSSNLRRLLEAGSLKLDATANGRVESPVNVGPSLSFSPPSHHAQQLSVLARKLAEKQDQSDPYTPSNRFIWNQGKWLPNSTTTCGLSPDSAILKLKAAANAVLQDKSLSRTEESLRFESFSSPFSSQSASSTLAALSKKVSERSLTPGQEHPPPASSFLSLASMTSSAALLKEVAARAAGSLLAEKSSLLPDDPLPLPPSEKKPEKVTPPPPPPPPSSQPQSLELLLLPVSKGRVSKPSNSAESYKETQAVKVKEEPMEVDSQHSPVSISPSRNIAYSTLMGREKIEPLQKLPEGRVPPERNLFSQDISVKMASELLFQLSEDTFRQSPFTSNSKDLLPGEAVLHGRIPPPGDDRKTPSESNSPSSSSLSTLSDSANGKDDSDSSQKNKGVNNLLVISVVPGSQPSLNSEEKPEKGFECVFCNFVCKTKNMFERHLQIHLITRMFECDVCHKFMKTPEQLLEHKKCHTVPTGGLKCPFCIYSTNRPAAMECHLKTHYKMEYKCRICQTVKANQLELETHTREHRLGNHYKCDQCGYLSKTANKLIEHVRVHTGERPFHCDQCSYSCKRKDNLNLHKKLKHAPRQTFSCGECLFKTTHPFVFSRHVKKHQSGDGPEEDKKGLSPSPRGPAGPGAPLLVVGGGRSLLSPLSVMSASQALQTVALSAAHGSSSEPNLAFKALAFNGSPLCLDKYRNSDFAHLIPLTMLYPKNHLDLTFHPPRPQTAPPSIPSPKHSFLAYLGLRERAETV